MSNTFRILVILPNNLGDIIMATPVLEGLKKKYPESHITFLAEKGFEGGIYKNPFIDRIFLFNRKTIRDLLNKNNWDNASDILKDILKDLNSTTFNIVLNLSQQQYISYLISLIATDSRYGQCFLREGNYSIPDPWTQYLYTIPFARRYNSFHAVDIYRRVAKTSFHRGGYTIFLSKNETEDAKAYLTGIGVDVNSEKIIVFQPGAAFATKRWPEEHFVKLGKLLTQNGWQVIISGASSEKKLAQRVHQEIGKSSFSTAGDTNFRQAIANLSFAKGCVTGDTALMHASAALNVQTYTLFGATSPVETGPYGNDHYIFSGECPQKPCFNNQCKTMHCMNSILPETVFSCIEGNMSSLQTKCDIYKSSLLKNNDYSILPVTPNAFSYYSSEGASFTKMAFEENVQFNTLNHEELQEFCQESQKCLPVISDMEKLLLEYLNKKDSISINEFENKKSILMQAPGIAQFWTALLNIRLNSVPLLDPLEGIKMSAQVCNDTKEQIKSTLSSINNSI